MTDWLLTSLFYLGIVFIAIGLFLIIAPNRVMTWGNSANRWISTNAFFNTLDVPHNYERFYYKQHRILGCIITVLSAISIYMLVFYAGMESTANGFEKMADSVFGKWLLQSSYYILTVFCVLTLIAGIIIFIRPSLLKSMEAWGNRWVDTQAPLKKFDEVHEIPTDILPGKPRLFGSFVLVGAIYITYLTGTRIF